MYSYSQDATHSSFQNGPSGSQEPTNQRDRERRPNQSEYYYSGSAEIKEEVHEEEEEPVLALDLRIGKATESISIFDDKNVLASTSSGFGPALPRTGQARLSAQSPAPAPYSVPVLHRRKSTSMQNSESLPSRPSNEPRLFRQPHNVSPRQVDCRKRFLEAALAAPSTPSPPPPPPQPRTPPEASQMLDSLRRETTGLMPSHFLVDNNYGPPRQQNYGRPIPPQRGPDPSDLLQNGRVSGQAKLSIWRPNLGPHPPGPLINGQLFCNPTSPYRCSIPDCVQPHSLMPNRSKSPVLEYPPHNVRSPHYSGGQDYHHYQPARPYDHPNLNQKNFPQKNSPYSFSHNSSQVQTMADGSVIKSEAPSPPPQGLSQSPMFRQPTDQPHDRVRTFQDTYLAERARETQGYASDPVEYKSSYLHHVLQRQRQQTSNAAEFLRRHYSSTVAAASTSSHQSEEEVSELDHRLRLIEQDSRLHDPGSHQGGSTRSRTPSPGNFVRHTSTPPHFRRFSPEAVSPTPIRALGSVLPLNLSKASGGMFARNDDDEEEPDFRRRLSPGDGQGQSISPFHETAPTPNHITPLSPASTGSTTPTPAALPQLGTESGVKGKRGRPRKHAPKIPLPPLYIFIRNLLHNRSYNPRIISWVSETHGIFKVSNTMEFARTWGRMKSNRSEEMNYEKMSRAMRYHYGSPSRKGHLAMVKEKRLVYRFGELAIRWRPGEVVLKNCQIHELCKQSLCLWTKE